jgi:hypothetical protein
MKLNSFLLVLVLMIMAGFGLGNRYPGPPKHTSHGLKLEERHRKEETNRFETVQ